MLSALFGGQKNTKINNLLNRVNRNNSPINTPVSNNNSSNGFIQANSIQNRKLDKKFKASMTNMSIHIDSLTDKIDNLKETVDEFQKSKESIATQIMQLH